jgi:hypothetical protein
MLRASTIFALVLALCACGSKPPEETTFNGNINGVTLSNPQALFSSQEGTLGVNGATVFVSDVSDCSRLGKSSATSDSRSAVHDEAGNRLPSLVLVMDGQSAFKGPERPLGQGFTASWDPGAPAECESLQSNHLQTDGGACPTVIKPDAGTAWIYESDSTKADDHPRAVAKYELQFGADSINGTVVAKPCGSVDGGCSASGGSIALLALLFVIGVWAPRRRSL